MVVSNSGFAASIILIAVFALAVHIPGCRAISPFYKRLLRDNKIKNLGYSHLNEAKQLVRGSLGGDTASNSTSAVSATIALGTNSSSLYKNGTKPMNFDLVDAPIPAKGMQMTKGDVDDSDYGRKTYTDIACSQHKTCASCVSDPDW